MHRDSNLLSAAIGSYKDSFHTPKKPSRAIQGKQTEESFSAHDKDSDHEDLKDIADIDEILSPRKQIGKQKFVDLDNHASTSITGSNLIITKTLKALKFGYLESYRLMICTICESGIPFEMVPEHAFATKGEYFEWDEEGKKKKYKKTSRAHQAPMLMKSVKKPLSNTEIVAQISQELQVLGLDNPQPRKYLSEDPEQRNAIWRKSAIPYRNQVGPIPHLTVFEHGYQCTTGSCDGDPLAYCTIDRETLRNHMRNEHPKILNRNRTENTDVKLQTMTTIRGLKMYFLVPPGTGIVPPPMPMKFSTELDPMEALHKQRIKFICDLPISQGDKDLVHPAFLDSGMNDFWSRCDEEVLLRILETVPVSRSSASRDTKLLMNVIIGSFQDLCRRTKKSHHSVVSLITKGAGYVWFIPILLRFKKLKTLQYTFSSCKKVNNSIKHSN